MTLSLWIMSAVLLVLLVLGLLVSVRGSRSAGRSHTPGNQHNDGRYLGYDSRRQEGYADGGADFGGGGDGP
jgi:hypothetical protein